MKDSKWWPWWQQALDAAAAALGVGLAISMAYRNSYPLPGVALVAACIGKISTSQFRRIVMEKWDEKP